MKRVVPRINTSRLRSPVSRRPGKVSHDGPRGDPISNPFRRVSFSPEVPRGIASETTTRSNPRPVVVEEIKKFRLDPGMYKRK